ncbi:TonB-dependent receptor domain-containing protein [Paraflavitalea speifideaquila]|uniref:TonB-dependent receptor domain-containing protein n=1 Tax=Paraflavitalea speifideaquila TaxID=3076558 RepID=UPI0028E32D67|nr:TonB-dependent receptor [Paraflavitalea speifideiaquila]
MKYDTLSKDNLFVRDAGRTNRFLYDEYISAGYAVYSYKVKKMSFRLSVRLEHTYTEANAFTQEPNKKRNYFTWLPGANFSYALGAQQQVNVSFTRRMTRPGFAQLNPFRFYLSPLNYWVGNPYLLPSVTSVLNLSYTHKNFNIGISLGKEEDVMTRYPEYNGVTNELLYLGATCRITILRMSKRDTRSRLPNGGR